MSTWQRRCDTPGCPVGVYTGPVCSTCGAPTVPLFDDWEDRPGTNAPAPALKKEMHLDVPDVHTPPPIRRIKHNGG